MSDENEKFWLEIQVPQSRSGLDKSNLEAVVNFAFNRGEVIESIIACTPSTRSDMDRNSLRWFLGFLDEHTRRDVRGHIEMEGFYVKAVEKVNFGGDAGKIKLDNLERAYDHAAELQATDHFAHGFLPLTGEPEEERTFEDYPPVSDRLASAIFPEGALRVVFERDNGAEGEVISEAKKQRKKRSQGPNLAPLSNFFRTFLSFGKETKRREEREVQAEQEVSEIEEKMRNRATRGLFASSICLYGPPRQINSVIDSLPLSPVALEPWKSGPTSGEEEFVPDLKPSRKRWKRTAMKWSPLFIPVILALALLRTGMWAPFETLESFWNFLPVLAIVASSLLPVFLLESKNPIVFSHDELTLFLSLPKNIVSVPHEPGVEAEPTFMSDGELLNQSQTTGGDRSGKD